MYFPRTSLRSAVLTLLPAFAAVSSAETVYRINLEAPPKAVQRGVLDLGGNGPGGTSIAVNSFYIEKNGKPFVPIVGEFHYSRYPAQYWEESLRKMKAGGINVVASYVFWNLHERVEGHFDWSGDLDLHRFCELIKKVGLQAIVRIGPFGHGEMRNGGLPDWLYGRPFEIRSNDPQYLRYVDTLYGEIAGQLHGLLFSDGGPVIGIQLENEFQHSAAPWEVTHNGAPKEFTVADRDVDVTHGGVSVSAVENKNAGYGRDHMANLKAIALKHGLRVPLYTATGWGNAAIVPRGSIPVTAAYPFPFWADPSPSPFYLFKDIQHNPDYLPVSYETDLYPSVPAELGAGIMPIYNRRPYVPEESIEPLIVRVLGSGSNGIGYYMYHGGATPVFDRFYNEDASGLPKINYDYQAPIGQYGQTRSHFQSLKLLHLFLESYGERLAPLPTVLPETNARITAADTQTLRFAARAERGSGFIFLVNYQDHAKTQDLGGLRLEVESARGRLSIPSLGTFTLKSGTAAILPVNLDIDGVNLRSATVQPLAILERDQVRHRVFFSIDGLPPELVFDRGEITNLESCSIEKQPDGAVRVSGRSGGTFAFSVDGNSVLVVPRELALQAYAIESLAGEKVHAPPTGLLFADATVVREEKGYALFSHGSERVALGFYPRLTKAPKVEGAALQPGAEISSTLSSFDLRFAPVAPRGTLRRITARKFVLTVDAEPAGASDVFVRVPYIGDAGMAFVDGTMIDDHYFFGRTWEIGLKRFAKRIHGKEILFVFRPLRKDASYLSDIPEDLRPSFAAGEETQIKVQDIELIPEYKASLLLQ